MKQKDYKKSSKTLKKNNIENKTKNPFLPDEKKSKINPKKNISKIKNKSKQKSKKNNDKQKISINIEDSSTNCLTGQNNDLSNKELKKYFINTENKENAYISYLINNNKESESESFFINFQLCEKESTISDIFSNNSSKRLNLKNNFFDKKINNINNANKAENDSVELYDFNAKSDVDYVLKNISIISKICMKSTNSIFEDCDECNDDKTVNKIKIFKTKNLFNVI